MALTAEELKVIREGSVPYSAAPVAAPPEAEDMAGLAVYPTAEEKRAAIQLGATQGATRAMAPLTGAVAGFKTGTAIAPFTGPAAPFMPAVGAVVGTGLGLLGAEQLDKLLFDEQAAAQRPDVAPYREGGKTFGESIAAAPFLFGLPVMTGNRVSRFISDIGSMARAAPKVFLAGETGAATMSGIAGGTSYAIDPEAKGARFGAEVTAGLLTPTRLVSQGVNAARDLLSGYRGATTAAGRAIMAEDAAARQLQQILTEHGEDIPKLIRLLEKPLPGSVTSPTAAQKTGSLVLSEMERALGNLHVKFAADTQAQGKEALRAYALLVDRLRDVGTPAALTRAAQMREDAFLTAIGARLATAEKNAAEKIVRIKQDTPAARAEIGEIVKAETSLALQNARAVEKMLWEDALTSLTRPQEKTVRVRIEREPQNQAERIEMQRTGRPPMAAWNETRIEAPTLAPSNTFNAFLERVSELGPASYNTQVPKVLQDIMQDLGATKAAVLAYRNSKNTREFLETGKVVLPGSYKPREVPVGDLLSYRSDLLELARLASAESKTRDASMYSSLADALLTDISQLKSPAFDAARDFSRALNDTFTRTFAKSATVQADKARTGAERLPAEILVSRAFGQNADVTAQRMNDIEDAVKFMRTQYDDAVQKFGVDSPQALRLKPAADEASKSVVSIQDAQTRIMRLMASQAVDPITGRVNPVMLQNFVNQNKTMLDKVGLTGDLTDAVKAEMALRQVAKETSVLNKTLRNQTAFAQVLAGKENPTYAVLDVLNSRSPVLGMNRMMQLAKSGGPGAVDGLKSTLMDYAFTKAGGIDNFDPMAFRNALFAPLAPNKPSLVGLMRQQGMMDFGEMRNINEIIRPMLRIEDAIANQQSLDAVMQGSGAVTELALRIVGSKLGASAAGHKGPGTLIAASAGSKAMRQIFDKMPAGMTRATIEEAMKDPQLLSLLLQKPTSVQQQRSIARDITARLVSSGTLPAAMMNYVDQPPEEPAQPVAPAAAQRRQAAPPVRGVPMPAAPGGSAPQKPPGGGQKMSEGPRAQELYQALFPQDTISSLMALQQPSG